MEDRIGAEADTGRERDAHRLVDPTELLDRDAQRGEVTVGTAVLLGEHDPEQAELAHLADDVDGEVVIDVPLCRVRRDLAFGELTHHGSEHLVLVGQLPCHGVTLTQTKVTGQSSVRGHRQGPDRFSPVHPLLQAFLDAADGCFHPSTGA